RISPLFPYPTLFRSQKVNFFRRANAAFEQFVRGGDCQVRSALIARRYVTHGHARLFENLIAMPHAKFFEKTGVAVHHVSARDERDRKSTRLNSSHT